MKIDRKRLIIIGLLLIVLIVSISLGLIFNYSMHNYVDSQAKRALEVEVKYYNSGFFNFDEIENTTFATSAIIFDDYENEGTIDDTSIDFGDEKTNFLYQYYIKNRQIIDTEKILTVRYNENKYYIVKAPNGDSNGGTCLLYVNTTPVQRLIHNINKIYIITIFILLIIVTYLGVLSGKKLEDSDQKMKEFFQNISHDLKTPIMSIQGYAEGIEKNIIEDKNNAAKIIMSESDKMVSMINEILELSKFENGVKKPNYTKTDLSEILLETLERVEPIAQKNKINFNLSIDEVVLMCDGELMERVFLNILTNAIRYANKTIDVECKVISKKVFIIIRDDGCKLTKDEAKNIFKRFYYGDKGSSGVGLALAKEIIDLHMGKIYAQVSDKTSFTIELNI